MSRTDYWQKSVLENNTDLLNEPDLMWLRIDLRSGKVTVVESFPQGPVTTPGNQVDRVLNSRLGGANGTIATQ
ncbi:MAG: hypothetical protein R3C03_15805 [Pirellulaceae bacterium]